jgi:hypothetical protein
VEGLRLQERLEGLKAWRLGGLEASNRLEGLEA